MRRRASGRFKRGRGSRNFSHRLLSTPEPQAALTVRFVPALRNVKPPDQLVIPLPADERKTRVAEL